MKELKVTDLRIGDYVGLKKEAGIFAYDLVGILWSNENSLTDATLILANCGGAETFRVKLNEVKWVRTLPYEVWKTMRR